MKGAWGTKILRCISLPMGLFSIGGVLYELFTSPSFDILPLLVFGILFTAYGLHGLKAFERNWFAYEFGKKKSDKF